MATFRISSYSYDQHARSGLGARMRPPVAGSIYSAAEPVITVSPPKQKRPSSAHSVNGRRSIVAAADQDFSGVTNVMRKITLQPNRRWRPTPTLAWSVDSETGNGNAGNRDASLREKNDKNKINDARRARSVSSLGDGVSTDDDVRTTDAYDESLSETEPPAKPKSQRSQGRQFGSNSSLRSLKVRVPRTYTNAPKNHFEETLPPCLKLLRSYQGYPRRQNCHHNPLKSVTELQGHQIKSRSLPHPGTNARGKRRPWSAPPARGPPPGMPPTGGPRKQRQRPASAHVMNNLKSSLSKGGNHKNATTTVRFDLVSKPPQTPKIEEAEEEEGEIEIIGRPDSANSMYSDDFDAEEENGPPPEHNGVYHVVHGAGAQPSSNNVVLEVEDESDDGEIPEDIH